MPGKICSRWWLHKSRIGNCLKLWTFSICVCMCLYFRKKAFILDVLWSWARWWGTESCASLLIFQYFQRTTLLYLPYAHLSLTQNIKIRDINSFIYLFCDDDKWQHDSKYLNTRIKLNKITNLKSQWINLWPKAWDHQEEAILFLDTSFWFPPFQASL